MNRYLERRMRQKQGRMREMDGHNYRGLYGEMMEGYETRQPRYEYHDDMRRGRGRDRAYSDRRSHGYDSYSDYNYYGDMRDRRSGGYDGYRHGMRDSEMDGYHHSGYGDYGYHSEDYAAKESDEEYKKDLKKWVERLKSKDKFKMPFDKVIEQAKNMGVRFDDYSELEFYAIYLDKVAMHKSISGEYSMYLKMAKDFFDDEESMLKGSEKVSAYLYEIVMGE